MSNNIVSANMKSSSITSSFDRVTATKNIINSSLNNTLLKNQTINSSAFYEDVLANLEDNPLAEYTLKELLKEGQELEKENKKKLEELEQLYKERENINGLFYPKKEIEIENKIKKLEEELGLEHRPDQWEKFIDNKSEKTIFRYIPFDYSEIDNQGFTAQGITTTDKGYIISAHNGHKDNSRLYFYNKKGNYVGNIILDNKAHVGGITYDSENGVIYVTSKSGSINAYSYDMLYEYLDQEISKADVDVGKYFKDVKLGSLEGLNLGKNVATTYYKDGYLYTASYVGNNTTENSTIFAKYKINYKKDVDDDVVDISYETVYETQGIIVKQAQGIAVTEYKGKEYLLVSQSNIITKSLLVVYELGKDGIKKHCGDIVLDFAGSEGVQIQDDGQVVVVSENADKTQILTMDEIFDKMDDFKPWWYFSKKIVDIGAGWVYDGGVGSIWDNAFEKAKNAGDYADIAVDGAGKTVNVVLDQIGLDIKDEYNYLAEETREIPLIGGFLGGTIEFSGELVNAFIDGAGDTIEAGVDYIGDGVETVCDWSESAYDWCGDRVEDVKDFFSAW